MTEKGSMLIHRIIGIMIAISIIVAGACLALGCCYVYFSEELDYSRTAVADVFAVICIPVYLCLSLTVLGFLTELLVKNGGKRKNGVAVLNETKAENILKARAADSLGKAELELNYREKGKRTLNSLIMTVLTAIGAIVFFVYALNGEHFDNGDINGSVVKAIYALSPCILIPFAFYLFLLIDRERGYKRILAALKSSANCEEVTAPCEFKPMLEGFDLFLCGLGKFFDRFASKGSIFAIRVILISVALLCLVFGLIFGGTADVFTKASNICTECIGLG